MFGNRYSLLAVFFLLPVALFGQRFTISGYIKDAASGETLPGASISIPSVGKNLNSNSYGFYSVTLPAGIHRLQCSFVGFMDLSKTVNLVGDTLLQLDMQRKSSMSGEVVLISRKSDDMLRSTQMGKISIDMQQLKSMPALLGEVDVVRSLLMLPGVANAGEANAGIYVRGGGADQNLILLDDAIVYNSGHLFGFFSVFNSDAIKNVSLIKGAMPAQYGGRLSSVLDISMKDGNNKLMQMEGGIGLISSRFSIQGPLKKEKSSFIFSARRTYVDVLTKPFISKESQFFGSGYYFYDANAKMNFILGARDKLFVSGYFGRDVFDFNNARQSFKVNVPWGNATGSIRWNHVYNKKLFANTTAVFNDYRFRFAGEQNNLQLELSSGIRDVGIKHDFDLFPFSGHRLKFGFSYLNHRFKPSVITGRQDSVVFTPQNSPLKFAHEIAAYFQDDWDISPRLKFQAGLRISAFRQIGPYKDYVYNSDGSVIDSMSYGTGSEIKTYSGWEPRLALRYVLNDNTSLKASYTRNFQYIHLVSSAGSTLPTDIWVPSTLRVKPQIGDLYSVGVFRSSDQNVYEASLEVYYKDLMNQIEYKEGYTPNTLEDVERSFTFGKGGSYGAEWFLSKKKGRLTGWFGYTWSRTWRQFPSLNGGKQFPAKFDRRHDLSIVAAYQLNESWKVSVTFVYATGNAVTLPLRFYFMEGALSQDYSEINQYRLPAYHRADMAFVYDSPKNKNRKIKSEWVFSIYNIYSRQNPYFIYFDQQVTDAGFKVQGKQVSIFPIIPAVTWNFKL
jgi:hypothetical protein